MLNPFVRVSRPHGHFSVPAAVAVRGGWEVLADHDAVDANGHPLPPKLRVNLGAVTESIPDPEADVSADLEETENELYTD